MLVGPPDSPSWCGSSMSLKAQERSATGWTLSQREMNTGVPRSTGGDSHAPLALGVLDEPVKGRSGL
jgi:hypothetical protein